MKRDDSPAKDRFELDSYLPFLLVRLGARLQSASEGLFVDKLDVNRRAWRVLATLMQKDGQGVTALAQATATELSTLSRTIDLMETRGLVEKRREKPSMRSVQVHLRPGGRALFEAMLPGTLQVERILKAGLTEREVEITTRSLSKLYANIDAAELYINSLMELSWEGVSVKVEEEKAAEPSTPARNRKARP